MEIDRCVFNLKCVAASTLHVNRTEHSYSLHGRLSLIPFEVNVWCEFEPTLLLPLLRMRQACESIAWRIQQEVLHDCALLPPSSNPVAALSVGDSHGL